MNCKSHDLAVIVTVLGLARAMPLLGKVVRLGDLARIDPESGPLWLLTEPLCLDQYRFECIADRILRPLRDPGPDAVDEMVRWCPAPKVRGVGA